MVPVQGQLARGHGGGGPHRQPRRYVNGRVWIGGHVE